MKAWLSLLGVSSLCGSVISSAQIVNNNSILYNGQIGIIPLLGTHNLSNKYAPLLVDQNGFLQTVEVDNPLYQPAATTTVNNRLAKVFITAGDNKPVQGAPIVGIYNGTYKPIATDGLGRLIITAPSATGITNLNNLNDASQVFETGTAGNDFAISSASGTHTFNLPSASATARGLVTTGAQTLAGAKTFSTTPIFNALSTGVLHSNVSGTITSSTIVNADVSASAAIAFSKLASLSSANIILGNASDVPTATSVTGDITISNAGVTSLAATIAGNKTFSNNITINGITTLNGVLSTTAAQNIKAEFVTTTPVTLNGTSNMILSNLATASIINLPDCAANEGRTYIIKNINVGSAVITPLGTQKIDGAATKTIAVKYSSMNLICASSNWYIY